VGGSRSVYAERRVAHTSKCAAHTAEALDQHLQQVYDRHKQFDLEELWTLLLDEGGGPYDLEALCDWAFPNGSAAAQDAVFWALYEDRLYFKRDKVQRYTPNSSVSVDERKLKLASELAAAAEMSAMVHWLRSPDVPADASAQKAIELLKELVLYENEAANVNRARELIRTAWPKNASSDVRLAWDFLVRQGTWDEHENLAVLRSKMPTEFSADVLADAEKLSVAEWETGDRADYRHWKTIAVDDERTTEVDDALAIQVADNGERTVGVFIADASQWIPSGCSVDKTAYERVTTVYLPRGKVPMLPPCLGQDRASLAVGEDRLVLAFLFTLSEDGTVIDFRIEEAVIRLSARLTYETVEAIMSGQDHEHDTDVRELSRLADIFRIYRKEQGALILDRFETTVNVDEGSNVAVQQYWTGGVSHRLVSEWMIVTCAHAAKWCREHQVPALYRGQDAPDGRMRIPEDRPLLPYELQQALRMIRGAFMTCEPTAHFGLGLACYSQVSSPLRRYPDLLMHRQIRHVLRRGQPLFTESDFQKMIESMDTTARSAGRVERASRRYWLLKSMESRRGESMEVEVLRPVGRRVLVHVLENGLRTLWSASKQVKAGDRCHPAVEVVDPRWDKLVFN